MVCMGIGLAVGAGAQTAEGPTFEVASIKPAEAQTGKGGRLFFGGGRGGPGTDDPGLFTCPRCNLYTLVQKAFDVPSYRLAGISNNMMEDQRYDVSARIAPGTTKEQFQLMLQNLLVERFKLKFHRETKDVTGYELSVNKGGIKMKVSPPEDPKPAVPAGEAALPPRPPLPLGLLRAGADGMPDLPKGRGNVTLFMPGAAKMHVEKETMEQFTKFLGNQLGGPITDLTGLKDKYDFDLTWDGVSPGRGGMGMPMVMGPPPGAGAGVGGGGSPLDGAGVQRDPQPTIFGALQSELGLKLDKKQVPVEVVVIEHFEKTPTEN